MEVVYFDETVFKDTIINDSITNGTIDFRDFIRAFTSKNSEDDNIKIVIIYIIDYLINFLNLHF